MVHEVGDVVFVSSIADADGARLLMLIVEMVENRIILGVIGIICVLFMIAFV